MESFLTSVTKKQAQVEEDDDLEEFKENGKLCWGYPV